jgi:hypothetical protein
MVEAITQEQRAKIAEQTDLNVMQAWPLYDTLLISQWVKGKNISGWVTSYRQFAQRQIHSFFNVRNQGETNLAYCNLETSESMPFAYYLCSLGIDFQAAIGRPADPPREDPPPPPCHNGESDAIFVKDIPRHIGVKLVVRQNDILLTNSYLTPSGAGPYGIANGIATLDGLSANPVSFTNTTQGEPFLKNRWDFPFPIQIPRGATYSVQIELSEYARDLLGVLCGPDLYTFQCADEEEPNEIGSVSSIQVSMIGMREIQQVGQLHY